MAENSNRKMIYVFNPVSIFGAILAMLGAILIIAFLIMGALSKAENAYLGIFTYFAFPSVLVIGLILVPMGAWLKRKRLRKQGIAEAERLPVLDLNDPAKLRFLIFFVAATLVFLVLVGTASYKGYEFTESTEFCGKLCHTVMEPEHTAWSNSPHAKIKCVDCHVGSGAKWYVKAKLSGLHQVWAVLRRSYPTPIETPIQNLRPARDTCEECHWPEKFYAGRQKVFYHYARDEENTPRKTDMLLHIGHGPNSKGIHWHIGQDVTFIARDKKRNDIPYVAVKESDGSITEYFSSENPIAKEEIGKAVKKQMDCVDCHNRPTHIYHSSGEEMDMKFVGGKIDRSLPYIKKVAVEILEKPYPSKEDAMAAITKGIPDFYAKDYPQIAKDKADAIKTAVEEVKDIYARNFFPKMRVSWNTYPSNLGHLHSLGCFRCHDGKHVSANNKVITKDCDNCHTMLGQVQENIPAGEKPEKPKSFVHPEDIGDELYQTNCSECHTAN